jgi:hypothetical protein
LLKISHPLKIRTHKKYIKKFILIKANITNSNFCIKFCKKNHLCSVPLSIIDHDRVEPEVLLLSPETVEVVSEVEPAVLDLEDAVLPVVLIADSEKLSEVLSGPEAQLNLRRVPVRLKGERVLDVALGPEGGGRSGLGATGARPAGAALALGLGEGAGADAVRLPTPDGRGAVMARAAAVAAGAGVVRLRAIGLAVSGHAWMRQVVQLQVEWGKKV